MTRRRGTRGGVLHPKSAAGSYDLRYNAKLERRAEVVLIGNFIADFWRCNGEHMVGSKRRVCYCNIGRSGCNIGRQRQAASRLYISIVWYHSDWDYLYLMFISEFLRVQYSRPWWYVRSKLGSFLYSAGHIQMILFEFCKFELVRRRKTSRSRARSVAETACICCSVGVLVKRCVLGL